MAEFAIAVNVDAVGPGYRLAAVTTHVIAGDRRTGTYHEGLVEFGVAVQDVYAGRGCRVKMIGAPGAIPLVANKTVARDNRDGLMGTVRQVAVRPGRARCRAVRRKIVTGDAIIHQHRVIGMAGEAADSNAARKIQSVTGLAAGQVSLGCPAMKVQRGFVDPIRAGKRMIVVTIVTTGRVIAKAAVQVMTGDTDTFLIDEPLLVMGLAAMHPGDSGRHFRTIGTKVALGAFDAEVMAVDTIQGAGAVEFSLIFVEPRLPGWMGVAVVAACRSIAERAIKIMTGCAGIVGINKDLIIVRCVAMGPIASFWHHGTVGTEMTLHAFSIQIMAIGTIKRACAVESSLVFVEPGLPQVVNVAVVAACRSIAERAIKIMTGCAGIVGINKDLIIMRDFAMVPGYACGHLGAAAAEMTLDAVGIQIMAVGTIQSACAVESGLVFVEPWLPQIVNVAVMAACRSIAERAVEIMAGCAGGVGIKKELIIMGG